MRNLLALVGAVVVLVVGLGWYLEWYKLGTEPAGSGHRKVNADVNTDKITEDLKKAREAVGGILHHDEKKVEGQPSGRNSDGSWGIVPAVPTALPPLPPPPIFSPIEINPDGTPKVVLPPPPPPPAFPKN
jgi:hypothetical protein